MYGLVTMTAQGRIADRAAMKVLRWGPGLRLSIRECHGLIVVSADQQGVFKVAEQGHVRLPAVVRHWCGLAAGDRVFIVAEPASRRLVVYPPAKLDEIVAQTHESAFGGDHE
ncbi:AbrB/MazE/SpoVT family DNA-binding domain-containing protein [Micromonospora sediminicola]|uniref:AbrB/MazE/SpoVT family DNA-binding domain-containing protein n=1 Tax=Micromonospora sediminicola TaxID=946078 RepID=UPI00379A5304